MNPSEVIKLHKKKIKLERQLEELKDDIEDAESSLLADMQKNGTRSLKPKNGGNIRISRIVRASAGGNVPRLVEACEKAGLKEFIKKGVNANTLAGYVREFDPDKCLSPKQIKSKLPVALRPAITITENIGLIISGLK